MLSFKGKGRGTRNGPAVLGTYDNELEAIMQHFLALPQYAFFRSGWLGVYEYDNAKLNALVKKNKTLNFLYWVENTQDFPDEDADVDEHWYAVFVDNVNMAISVFDSSGIHDQRQIASIKKKMAILRPEYEYKLKLNGNNL